MEIREIVPRLAIETLSGRHQNAKQRKLDMRRTSMETVTEILQESGAAAAWGQSAPSLANKHGRSRPEHSYIEIRHLLSQFQRNSPVRSIAEDLLGGSLPRNSSCLPLFNALANGSLNYWREQIVAAWAMGRVPLNGQERDAAAGMLLDALERDEAESLWERFLRGLFWGYGIMFPVSLIGSVLLCSGDSLLEWADVFPKMLFALGSFTSVFTAPFCLVYGHIEQRRLAMLRAASAESLGRLRVIESIGPLAEGLFDSDPTVNEASAFALMEILPQLSEEDQGLIHHQSLHRLATALNHPNSLLVFKVLEALRVVGTGSTLAAVERVAREGKTRGLREMAKEVMAVLEERRRREKESRHLVRPTIAPLQEMDELLLAFPTSTSIQSEATLQNRFGDTDDWV